MKKDTFTALLGAGTEYQGKLQFEGTIRVDGKFFGDIESEGRLIVGKGAHITGTVKVAELVVSGSIQADIEAKKIVILHKTAEVFGALTTPKLEIDEGAILQGQVNMLAEARVEKINTKATKVREDVTNVRQ